jgi:glycosyltransferase involved in cell wall biosynthesis
VDLLLSVPAGKQATWHGQIVDMDRMAAVEPSLPEAEGGRLRVSHAPTNKAIKGTRFVQRGMRTISGSEMVLILNKKWDACLALKASTDIFVDQLTLGYGNNAIEAWALGLPVIAGASEAILARMRKEYRGPVPFYASTEKMVGEDIRKMLASAELRQEWAERGMKHVRKFHAPEAWVRRAHRIYAGDSQREDAAA